MMTTFQALVLMIAFASLVVSIVKDKKQSTLERDSNLGWIFVPTMLTPLKGTCY